MEKLSKRDFVLAAAIGGLAVFGATLLLLLVLIVSGAVPLASTLPATVINVLPSEKPALPDAGKMPQEPIGEEAEPWEAPESIKRLAAVIDAQDSAERKKGIEAQYQAHLSEHLRVGLDPGIISKYIDPALDPEKMKKGDVGTFATIRVLQILDGQTFLAAVDDGDTVIIGGMSTADMADGRVMKGREICFEVVGPISYSNTFNAKRTVMAVKTFDATEYRAKARNRLKEAWAERTGRKANVIPTKSDGA